MFIYPGQTLNNFPGTKLYSPVSNANINIIFQSINMVLNCIGAYLHALHIGSTEAWLRFDVYIDLTWDLFRRPTVCRIVTLMSPKRHQRVFSRN